MKKITLTWLVLSTLVTGEAFAVGKFLIPQIDEVDFDAYVVFTPPDDTTTQEDLRFYYNYSLYSDASNLGDISYLFIDIKNNNFRYFVPEELEYSKPKGKVSSSSVMERFERYSDLATNTIEVLGTNLPQYWNSNPTRDGYLFISPPAGGVLDENGQETFADLIEPGELIPNLEVVGIAPPTLREVVIVPDWYLVVDGESEAGVLREQAEQLSRDLQIRLTTIGPESVSYGGYSLHDRLARDIQQMIDLGWINDDQLVSNVQLLLTDIRGYFDANDGTQAKVLYQQISDLVSPATETQMKQEAKDLILISTILQLAYVPDTRIPVEPALISDPDQFDLPIGDKYEVNTIAVDLARGNQPIPHRNWLILEVLSGPNSGLILDNLIDVPEGETFGYVSTEVGVDEVLLTSPDEDDGLGQLTDLVQVSWLGGPDYVISFFSPPYLEYRGDQSIFVQDHTRNIGTITGGNDTITRYYLSSSPNIDIENAYQLTERVVSPLGVDEENESGLTELLWPNQFAPGIYYFAACVDADNQISELNELNNCSFHSVEKLAYKVSMVGEEISNINVPPNCDQAQAVPDSLWPPNHKYHDISIEGVVDVDQDEVTIEVTAITQDEPVDGIGSGNTSPDGKGIGTSVPSVRAERSGTEDGRVYAIQFSATDSANNVCTGSVNVAVNHDKGKKGNPAVDSGQIYDSTQVFE